MLCAQKLPPTHTDMSRCKCVEHSEDFTEKWHGTCGGYSNHYCRCLRCKEAKRKAAKKYYDANPLNENQKIKAALRSRKYKELNRDKVRERSRRYWDDDPTGSKRESKKRSDVKYRLTHKSEKSLRDFKYRQERQRLKKLIGSDPLRFAAVKSTDKYFEGFHNRWSCEDDLFLITHWSLPNLVICHKLKRTYHSVKSRKQVLRKKGLAPE